MHYCHDGKLLIILIINALKRMIAPVMAVIINHIIYKVDPFMYMVMDNVMRYDHFSKG